MRDDRKHHETAGRNSDIDDQLELIEFVPEPSKRALNNRQLLDYREHRREFLTWALREGKDPRRGEGYSVTTMDSRASRLDRFYRWKWRRDGDGAIEYATDFTHEDATEYIEELATSGDYGRDDVANMQKAIKTLFKWRHHEKGDELWDPDRTYSNNSSTTANQEYLSLEERKEVRDAALEYDSIPHYNSVTPEQRREWKRYLAQKFAKPVYEIGPEDWERANGWKIPSLVWTSLDAGLRPIEVERAHTGWVDTSNGVLRIPKEDAAKIEEPWAVALRDRTVKILAEWLEERTHYDEYADTDTLWLTREGNPYSAGALKHLLERLCEEAGIDTHGRSMSWYAIRRSTATYMVDKANLSAAQTQMRHTDPKTTARYDQTPVENRKETLDEI